MKPVDDLPIVLDRTSRRALADQVAEQLRRAAADGLLRPGDRLPSTRGLAAALDVSRTVTAAAYEQLYAEGWLTARRGSGTFLQAVPVAAGRPAVPRSSATVPVGDGGVDLRPGSPWAAGLNPAVWRRAWRRAADDPPEARPARAGSPAFRAAVEDHLLRHRGLALDAGDVLATNGTTAAVTEVALALLEPGDAVAVEEPGYPRAVGALRACGVRVVQVPVDADGLIVDALPDGVRAVYCTPAHQYPLGGRMPATRRSELVRWAREHRAWVFEDDYDGELRYDVAPLPLLGALGPDVVIHLGTTSKIISPALGVGWLVGPPDVTSAVVAYRETAGASPSLAGQRVLTALAGSGDLSRHLRRLRRELAVRRDEVVRRLGAVGLDVLGDKAGAHIVVPLRAPEAEGRVIEAAARAGVRVDGLARCFAGEPSLSGVTVGYAAPETRGQLESALAPLAHALVATPDGRFRDPDFLRQAPSASR